MANQLLKPAEFVEKQIIEGIIEGRYIQGAHLPAERILAGKLGVTRPTLREALQRLSRDGWVTIQHGKPTRVNHFLKEGGLKILSALVRHGSHLTKEMVSHLLEVRTAFLPDIASRAMQNDRHSLLSFLKKAGALADDSAAYAIYDWKLQQLMVELAANPVFNMIFNDFKPLYEVLAEEYFKSGEARNLSRAYYRRLAEALEQRTPEISAIVENALAATFKIWQQA